MSLHLSCFHQVDWKLHKTGCKPPHVAEIEDVAAQFQALRVKYSLNDEDKAAAIADYLVQTSGRYVTSTEFCEQFGMTEDDARIFLQYVGMGIELRDTQMTGPDAAAQLPLLP